MEDTDADSTRSLAEYFHPLDLRLIRGIRERSARDPLWKVMAWAVRECNVTLDIRRGGICREGPQLVLGNDPSPLAGFVVLSLMTRLDTLFLGAPGWMKMGGSVTENCLPVYTVGRFRTQPKEAFRAHVIYRFRDGVTPAAAGRINVKSLARAADVITQGGTLAMLPAGGTIAKSDNWKHGVGHIAAKVGDVPARVVFIHVAGTKPRDAVRMLNPHWFRRLRKPLTLAVEFSDPFLLEEFRRPGMSPRDVSLQLRERYIKLYGSL
ncbi:MAG: hypothetical protein V1929_04070 [bacterium]